MTEFNVRTPTGIPAHINYLSHWPPANTSPPKKASFMMDDIVGSSYENRLPSSGGSTGSSPINTDSYSDGSTSPRPSDNGTQSSHGAGSPVPLQGQLSKKNRSSFSAEQVYQLERNFELQQYIGTKERQQLAQALNMTDNQVKTWFQNRRMKHKRKRAEVTQHHAKLAYINSLSRGLTSIQQPGLQPGVHGYQPPVYPSFPGCQPVPQFLNFSPEMSPLHRSLQPPTYREFPGSGPEYTRPSIVYREFPGSGPEYSRSSSSPPPDYPGLQIPQQPRERPGVDSTRMLRHYK